MAQDIQETIDKLGDDKPLMKRMLAELLARVTAEDWLIASLTPEQRVATLTA